MKLKRPFFMRGFAGLLILATLGAHGEGTGVWKTAYVKRGVVGNYDAGWAGGTGATLRVRVPIPFDGTQVRVRVRGAYKETVELSRMTLVRGADDQGRITGPQYPVLFGGQAALRLTGDPQVGMSDIVEVPVTRGTWYVQESYASAKYPYAYEVDRAYFEPGDHFDQETLKKSAIVNVGIVTRIDVFTRDTRPTILCYGDSITHGYGSTPNAGHRYPDVLGRLLDRPTLNLGMNSDLATRAGVAAAADIGGLKGVETVIFLMGINDIIMTGEFSKAKYAAAVPPFIAGCRERHIKVYLGTILPAGGVKAFDKDPGKEALRQEINSWIRTAAKCDGVIDFDAALADPENPTKLRADCQSDWIHPSDEGYRRMAEAAAKVIAGR